MALSAARLGIRAVIVMPLATPDIKLNAVKRFGGDTVTVKLHGQNYDEAAAEAHRLVRDENLTLIHPFNDEVIHREYPKISRIQSHWRLSLFPIHG